MGISRSSFYAPPADRPDDSKIVGEMQAIADEFEAYGYRRMTAELQPSWIGGECQESPPPDARKRPESTAPAAIRGHDRQRS
jgi:hypothetical protein